MWVVDAAAGITLLGRPYFPASMMASWTEIAIDMARVIARQNGCELDSFSLDGVETYEDDGVEMVMIKATARIAPADDDSDDIPFDAEPAVPIVS